MKRKIVIFCGALLLVIPLLVVADGVEGQSSNHMEQIDDNSLVDESVKEYNNQNDGQNENFFRSNSVQGRYDRPCVVNGSAQRGFGQGRNPQAAPSTRQQVVLEDMLEYVKEYTPNKLQEWEAVLEERNKLREQWFANRPSMNSETWRGQGRGPRHHMNRSGYCPFVADNDSDEFFTDQQWFCEEVYDAVNEGNEEKIAEQLNDMLEHLKERNSFFKDRLNNIKR